MLKRVGGPIVLLIALCGIAVGCGGGSDEPLTQAEFVKQGNAICKEAEVERGKILGREAEQFDPNGNVQAQQSALIQATIPTYEEAAEQLAELEPPANSAKKLDELVAAMKEAAKEIKANPQTAIVSDVQFSDASKKAAELKLDKCAI